MAMAQDGHDIGNHTYSHLLTTAQTPAQLQQDIVKCHQILTGELQRQPQMFFRPPQLLIDDDMAAAVQACGYGTIVMSELSPHDWDPTKSADAVLKEILDTIENGSIITLHTLDNSSARVILEPLILELKDRGYSFAKLSDYFKG
jgi:peptidoglycan/xylan/chitin deacetylase (PgdA/CDA1 family)